MENFAIEMSKNPKFPKRMPPTRAFTEVQSTLGFMTRGLAVDLALATGRAVTDIRQYINSDLVTSNLGPYVVK